MKSKNLNTNTPKSGKQKFKFSLFFFLIPLLSPLLFNCESSTIDPSKVKPFEGPTLKTFDMKMVYTDSGKVKTIMNAPLRLEYKNGDETYPNGIVLDFYNAQGEKYTRLTADKAHKLSKENKYTAFGNVVVINTLEKQQLNTEELNWTPSNHKITTDKNVTITTETEILKGKGMTARQDFSTYKITKPTGKFSIEKE